MYDARGESAGNTDFLTKGSQHWPGELLADSATENARSCVLLLRLSVATSFPLIYARSCKRVIEAFWLLVTVL
jgi:hypothetical protein